MHYILITPVWKTNGNDNTESLVMRISVDHVETNIPLEQLLCDGNYYNYSSITSCLQLEHLEYLRLLISRSHLCHNRDGSASKIPTHDILFLIEMNCSVNTIDMMELIPLDMWEIDPKQDVNIVDIACRCERYDLVDRLISYGYKK